MEHPLSPSDHLQCNDMGEKKTSFVTPKLGAAFDTVVKYVRRESKTHYITCEVV